MPKHGIIYESIKNLIAKKQGTYLLYDRADIKTEKDIVTKQVPWCNTVSMLSTNCVGINPEMPIINLAYCILHKKEIDECRIIPKQIIFTNEEEAQTFMDIVEKIENLYNKLPSTKIGSNASVNNVNISTTEINTIKIGNQEWTTENLNLTDKGLGKDHWKNPKNGEVYYSWKAAMRIAKKVSGYHIPTVEEWNELIQKCDGICRNPKESLWRDFYCEKVKEILKIKLVGAYFTGFWGYKLHTTFWTGTEYCQSEAWSKNFDSSSYIESSKLFKGTGYSVRLVKDNI